MHIVLQLSLHSQVGYLDFLVRFAWFGRTHSGLLRRHRRHTIARRMLRRTHDEDARRLVRMKCERNCLTADRRLQIVWLFARIMAGR